MLLVGFVVRQSSKRRNFQCVYREANGVRSRGLATRQTLWERKCKTNKMRTSLTRREHMKARRRWSRVRGAAQTPGTPFDPSMRRTCFVAFAHFLRFTDSLGTGSHGSSRVLRLEAPARAIPKSVWGRLSCSSLVSRHQANTAASVGGTADGSLRLDRTSRSMALIISRQIGVVSPQKPRQCTSRGRQIGWRACAVAPLESDQITMSDYSIWGWWHRQISCIAESRCGNTNKRAPQFGKQREKCNRAS